ncbi:putative B3 domain-containing protein REM15 [Raphanus sativus]|nr:putative B3 domain-containing protein REM15 [Raphanus sativus]
MSMMENIAKLRSDTSEITWIVKIEDCLRLTEWLERVRSLAHDLRVGDIVIFRQEKDMAFHVTNLLGPSCCEIQYGSCLPRNKLVEVQSKKQVRRDTKGEAESCTLLDSILLCS